MQVDDKMIKYLEELSHIALSDDERTEMAEGVQRFMDKMAELKTLDTEGVAELVNPLQDTIAFREDKVEPSLDRTLLLQGARNKNDEMFIAPKTVE